MLIHLFILLCANRILAQDSFTPPQAYPIERYKHSWKRNPFTIKTAPQTIPKESFAGDWTLVSMYQLGANTVVVVANTKTQERVKLRNDEPAPNGMRIKAAFIEDTRKESHAEIILGNETATLRYQQHAIKHMAAQSATAKLVESLVNKQPDAVAMNVPDGNGNDSSAAAPLDLTATVSSVPSGRRARLVIPTP